MTIGLYYYELRGIQHRNGMMSSARKIEHALLGHSEFSQFRPFSSRPASVLHVGATEAAFLIYPSVAGAWTSIATGGDLSWASALASGVVAVGLAVFGWFVMRRQQGDAKQTKRQDSAEIG